MNLSFHALAWLCVAQALFVICTSRQSVPRYGAAPQGAAPRRAPFRSLVGVKMTLVQFREILHSMGVEEIKALGEKFDPNLHAAVAHEDDESYGENEVILEMLKGYKYKDKVIRHSMVKVAN